MGRGGKELYVTLPAAIFDALLYDLHVCALLNMAHTDLCLLLTWLCLQT